MKDYIKLWSEEFSQGSSLMLTSRISATGERNICLGPRIDFARIELSAEPAAHFEIVDGVAPSQELEQYCYLDWAVFGVLDIFLLADPLPLTKVKLTLEKADLHPIHSSQMAFRYAGRDAARKILQATHLI